MATNFIPPIPIGQFRPSSEAIASWLYEVWKYLQENPIPSEGDITGDAEQVVENYVTVNVPPMIAQAISALSYNDFVNGTSLPIYRASNDEIGPEDLLEAWNEGCRIALVDDENVYIMYKDGNTVDLVQVLTESQSSGVVSVNGESGIVTLNSTKIPNASSVSGANVTAALNTLAVQKTSDDIANASNVSGANVTAALNTINTALSAIKKIEMGYYETQTPLAANSVVSPRITFSNEFSSSPYVFTSIVNGQSYWSDLAIMETWVQTTGFNLNLYNRNISESIPSISVYWMAIGV